MLSGGLPINMYAHLSAKRLAEIERDALLVPETNADIIEQIRGAIKVKQEKKLKDLVEESD